MSDHSQSTPQPPEEALRASWQQLAGILDIADDAIISVDGQQQITFFNQGAERIFQYTAQEILGQSLELLMPARFEQTHRLHLLEFAASGETARRMGERRDIYGRRKDGTEFPAEASISKLALGSKYVFTVILRDITARKQVEQKLREQNAELERAIQAKDRFLASMSHELRTPLNAIIGFTGTLLMRLPGPLTSDQEKQLRTVQSSARHLLSLINDLLDLAKIESGKVDLRLGLVNCRAVIEEVAASLKPLAEAKRLHFIVELPEHDLLVRADQRALSQIVINLASNAIKFTDSGEVHLCVAEQGQPGNEYTAISVRDTGIGIAPEDQIRLFDAFARAEGTRTSEGAGLGLYLSQKLAGLLGGRIEFQSVAGQGSTFSLILPGANNGTDSGDRR